MDVENVAVDTESSALLSVAIIPNAVLNGMVVFNTRDRPTVASERLLAVALVTLSVVVVVVLGLEIAGRVNKSLADFTFEDDDEEEGEKVLSKGR